MNQTERLLDIFIALGKIKMGKNKMKISQGEMAVLNALYLSGNLTPSQICEMTHMSSAHTGKTICALRMKNDVNRVVDKIDKRKALVSLTQQGQHKICLLYLEVRKELEELVGLLGFDDTEDLIRVLEKYLKEKMNHDSIKEYK